MPVKPLSPYTRDSQRIVDDSIIDYESGRVMWGVEYFKPLSKTIAAYCEHPEHKYAGNTGYYPKDSYRDDIDYIGKEANSIDDQPLSANSIQVFIREKDILERILAMPKKEAERRGVDRGTFSRIKKRIRKGGRLS